MLEARIRAPTTAQRDVLRARIVLAGGRRAARRARLPRGRYDAAHGQPLARPLCAGGSGRSRRQAASRTEAEIHRARPAERILAVLERPPPAGFGRWTGGLIAAELGDVHEQQVWRFLRASKIDLDGAQVVVRERRCRVRRQGRRRRRPLSGAAGGRHRDLCRREAVDPGAGAGARLSQAAQRAGAQRPQPRLQAPRHHDPLRRPRPGHRQGHGRPQEATPAHRVPRLHERHRRRLSGQGNPRHPRQSQYPQAQERSLAQAPPNVHFHFTPTYGPPGSTRSKSGSPSLPANPCAVPPSPPSPNSGSTSMPSSKSTMPTHRPSSGPKP